MIVVILFEHLHHKESQKIIFLLLRMKNEDGVRGNDNGSNTENR
ncbi:MAG: hypothetical protein AB8W78_02900 [Arsenophonus endosymbiont of Dermacentor nuttalli]